MLKNLVKTKKLNRLLAIALVIFGLGCLYPHYHNRYQQKQDLKLEETQLGALKANLDKSFREKTNWPEAIKLNDKELKVEYTFNLQLSNYIKKLLSQYHSDYSTVIVIDNNTGEILSAIGHQRDGNQFSCALPFSSTHPSASLIKIVTAAELLQHSTVDAQTVFSFNGRSTTLFRYQLRDNWTRWSRHQSLKDAFAKSNNVIFAKAAINFLKGDSIYQMANDFGFNQELMREVTLSRSTFPMPIDQFHLAELASGYNDQTLISPVHAALLASIVANDGVLVYPSMVSRLLDSHTMRECWQNKTRNKRVLDGHTSAAMREMMENTIVSGTARGSFRRMAFSIKKELRIGGKTGSITGGIPFGKRDWFTVYAVPKDPGMGKGISISVMNVNVNKWFVRSTYLAKSIIEYYYQDIFLLNRSLGQSKKREISSPVVKNKIDV
ncbi:MAG: penicillin-binding transpeptidase domain-containing protein [Pseudomonadota bacterium]